MKSNLPPLPKLDGDGVYRRSAVALDHLRHGNTFQLIAQVRAMFARFLARLLLPSIDCATFMKADLVDFVDVGAAGGFHRRWAPFVRHIRAHLFEPEDAAFAELKKSQSKNPNLRIYPNALSSDNKPIVINITAWPRASGVYAPDNDFLKRTVLKNHLQTVRQVTVANTVALDAVLEHADFIKIDVEGFELSVLRGATALLGRTLGLELEMTFFDRVIPDKPLFSEVDAFCRAQGFVLIKFFDTGKLNHLLDDRRYEVGGILYATNALYVRLPNELVDAIRSGTVDVSAMWRMAVIYLAYGQLELARTLVIEAGRLNLAGEGALRLQALSRALAKFAGIGRLVSTRTLRSIIELIGPLD